MTWCPRHGATEGQVPCPGCQRWDIRLRTWLAWRFLTLARLVHPDHDV